MAVTFFSQERKNRGKGWLDWSGVMDFGGQNSTFFQCALTGPLNLF
ncbi:MAG: hypothetical protein KIS77_10600 [Saprospiraceae bacterium]|nr:hypothetical protein [Saprospiraceae bacterium]